MNSVSAYVVVALVALVVVFLLVGKYRTTATHRDAMPMAREAAEAFAEHKLGIPRFDEAFGDLPLDYSIQSLKFVDQGLERLRQELPEKSDDIRDLSLVEHKALLALTSMAGSYLGEVIRRNSAERFRWRSFADLPEEAKTAFGGKEDMSNFLVLQDLQGNGFSLPMNRIGRFLINGSEDSVYAFAVLLMKTRGEQ